MRRIAYNLYTIFLFTSSDIKTMILPSIAFALSHSTHLPKYTLVSRLPLMLLYTWINLLAFTINNQCSHRSIAEDTLNKPWRPIPSARVSATHARTLGIISIPVSILVGALIGGGITQSVLIAILGIYYNYLGGGSAHWVIRNALNAIGFVSFASGTLEVALQASIPFPIFPWIALIAVLIGSTVHVQDMYDQIGDAAAGRRTFPLVVGDAAARRCIALVIMFWTVSCPAYWGAGILGFLAPMLIGGWVCVRTLRGGKDDVEGDRLVFWGYNIWLISLYILPITSRF